MVNLGLLTVPEKINVDLPRKPYASSIKFYSKYTDLLIAITQHYEHIYVLNIVWLYIRESHNHFYYRYDISTNFYKTKDEQTGLDKVAINDYFPCGIHIFLGRNYI
jgi:hypothetical protein